MLRSSHYLFVLFLTIPFYLISCSEPPTETEPVVPVERPIAFSAPATTPITPPQKTVSKVTSLPSFEQSCKLAIAEIIAGDLFVRKRSLPEVLVTPDRIQRKDLSRMGKVRLANMLRSELNQAADGRIAFIDPTLAKILDRQNAKRVAMHIEGQFIPLGNVGKSKRCKMILRIVESRPQNVLWGKSYMFDENR